MKRLLTWVGVLFLLFITSLIIKTLATQSLQPQNSYRKCDSLPEGALARLAESLKFETVSYEQNKKLGTKLSALQNLYVWLKIQYPTTFRIATTEQISSSLLITIQGSHPELKPALFLAHLDVVPADSGMGNWKFPPFSGHYTRDTVYGRGTLDDKSVAIAMLEAIESQLNRGFKPQRSICFAFGEDEEIGGKMGAAKIASALQSRNFQAEFICDEGFGVMEGLVPGTKRPVGLIGIAEKGFLSVKLIVDIPGGHSSMPKKENATAVLSEALTKIENTQFYEGFPEPQEQFFRFLAPEVTLGYRILFSNLWVTRPAVRMVLYQNEKTAATVQTSHATTIIQAGNKDNILPEHAEATVNFRMLPGQSISEVMVKLKASIANPKVKLEMYPDRNEASKISPTQGYAWDLISGTIHECFENVVTAPALTIGGTDCKHYQDISSNIYRFVPFRLNNENLGGIHGANEQIAAQNYAEAICYYKRLFGKL